MNNEDHGFDIHYQVQYQQENGKPDEWAIMTGRDHKEKFRSDAEYGMHELTDMAEANEIAEALVKGYAHPHKRDAYYWKKIVAARVVTRVYMGSVSATYGTPIVDVPRETPKED